MITTQVDGPSTSSSEGPTPQDETAEGPANPLTAADIRPVLETLDRSGCPAGVQELSEQTDLAPQRVRKLLVELQQRDYLVASPSDGYTLQSPIELIVNRIVV